MKQLLLLCAILCTQLTTAQAAADAAKPAINVSLKPVDSEIVREVAKKSDKKNTLFYTFGVWCEPCRLHLPTAIKLAKDYTLNFMYYW